MTSQMQPLEVGVPLYPFSHAGVFSKEAVPQDHTGAPLPDSSQYPDAGESPTAMTGLGASASASPTIGNWLSPAIPTIHPRMYAHVNQQHHYPH